MSIDRYLVGLGLLALTIGPLAIAAVSVRSRVLAGWRGAPARVAETIFVLGALTAIGQLLGLVGIFERWTVVAASVVAGTATYLLMQRSSTEGVDASDAPDATDAGGPIEPAGRIALVIAMLAAALIAIQWLAPSLDALHGGMQRSVDTLWYHGPMAARFAQEGSITAVHYFDDNPITAYFPGGTALLHATGIVLMGDDILSPILNLGFVALAMASAWVIGRSFAASAASLLGVLVVLGTPTLIGTQPGGDYNDVVGLALVLASVALLLRAKVRGAGSGGFADDCRRSPKRARATNGGGFVLAAVAAGLAVGVKLTMLAPVGALTIGVVLIAGRGRRWRMGTTWLAMLGALGGFWYVRNLAVAGNPLPGLELSLGPISLPELPTSTPIDDVAHYLTNWTVIRDLFIPGLDTALGPGWPVILLAAVGGGALVTIWGRDAAVRMIGGVAVIAFIGFLFSPQYLGLPGIPFFFSANVRYSVTALALGLAVLPSLPVLQSRSGRRVLIGLLAAVVVVTQLHASDVWPAGTAESVGAALAVGAAVLVALWWSRAGTTDRRRRLVAAVGAVLVVGGAFFVQRDYRDNRYSDPDVGNLPVVAALRHRSDVRIATQGLFLQYPLYGPDLSNHVQYLGSRGPNGGFAPFRSCAAWKRAINEGAYDFVLVARSSYPRPAPEKRVRAFEWARSDLAALREIARDDDEAVVYRVVGRLDPATCPR